VREFLEFVQHRENGYPILNFARFLRDSEWDFQNDILTENCNCRGAYAPVGVMKLVGIW